MADNPTQNVNENATTDDTQNDEAIVAEIHCMRMILDKQDTEIYNLLVLLLD